MHTKPFPLATTVRGTGEPAVLLVPGWCGDRTVFDDLVAGLGVVGPTRMDYPTTMAAVRAVATYVSRILAQ